MNAVILETTKARMLGLEMQLLEIITQRKFVSAGCHALSNSNKRPQRPHLNEGLFLLSLPSYAKKYSNRSIY